MQHMLFKRLLIPVACLLWSIAGQCNVIELSSSTGAMPWVPWADLYVDENRQLSVEEVAANAPFQPSNRDDLSFGFTKARIWLRLRIHNGLEIPQNRILYFRYFLLDNVTLYLQHDGEFSAQHSGRRHLDQHNQSLLPTRFFHFEMTIPPNTTQVYYLLLESQDGISSRTYLVSLDQFQRVMVTDTITLTFFSGLILANLCFALFMLAKLRERELLYYVGFLVFHHLCSIMILEGVPASLLKMESLFWNRTGFILLVNLAVVMSVLFFRTFLKLKDNYPSYYSLSRVLLVITLISTIQCLLLPHVIGAAVSTILCMIAGTGILFTCIRCAMNNDRSARLFLLSWSAGITGASIYCLKLWGIFPINSFTDNAWLIGAILEAILFSFTIADRVSMERRMRLQTQVELVEQERALRQTQAQLLETETAAKEELEFQVHERTKDISRILGELESQNRQLTELSINDGLTKVRNRRFFDDVYPELWHEAEQSGKSVSVIMLDIDHFKAVNDNYGHLVGDQCLVAVATCLREVVSRPKDIICRYGGEEFIIVLFDTELKPAAKLAERLRKAVSEGRLHTENGELTVTASLGVAAAMPDEHICAKDLIAQSDDALYQSKTNGRNRVTLARKTHSWPASSSL